jgi:hypothetical protein
VEAGEDPFDRLFFLVAGKIPTSLIGRLQTGILERLRIWELCSITGRSWFRLCWETTAEMMLTRQTV